MYPKHGKCTYTPIYCTTAGGTQENDNDTENDGQKTESSSHETFTTFHSKSPCEHCENSNLDGTLIMKCPKCFWHDYYKICRIGDHQIPEERNHTKEGFLRCRDCGAITQKREDVGNQFLFPF